MPVQEPGGLSKETFTGGDSGRIEPILTAGFAAALIIPLLYILRRFDGNTLVSWRWVFAERGIQTVFPFLFAGILLCYLPARLDINSRKVLYALLGASLLLPAALYCEPEIILDAGRYFLQAKHLEEHGPLFFLSEWGGEISAWTDLPLVPLIYGLVLRLFGESRIYIQILNTLVFFLTLLCTWRIGALLWGREAGSLAVLMLLGVPYLLIQVPLMLVDVFAMFLLSASILAVLETSAKGGVARNLAVAMALASAMLSKYSIWIMISMIPAMYLVQKRQNVDASILRALPGLGLAAGIFLAFAIYKIDVIGPQLRLLTGYQMAGLGRWTEGPASTFLFQIHPFLTAFVLYALYQGIKRREAHVVPALLVLLIVVLFRAWRIRYLIPLLPVLALLAARGLGYLRYPMLRNYLGFTTAFCSLAIVFTAYLPFVKSTSLMNLKLAGEFMNERGYENIDVRTLPQRSSTGSTAPAVAILDIYTNGHIRHAESWDRPEDGTDTDDSSLRFTWEINKPGFYKGVDTAPADSAAIVYSDMDDLMAYTSGLGETHGQLRKFDRAEGVFRYKTLVAVYTQKNPRRGSPD